MKKAQLINSNISFAISRMGHGDTITIADAGLPIPESVERIDLAVSENIPDFISTLAAVLSELKVERAFIAEEMHTKTLDRIKPLMKDAVIERISHEELKEMTTSTKAVIRTGEFTPYANIILVSGVVF